MKRNKLDELLTKTDEYEDSEALARFYQVEIIAQMDKVRESADTLELLVGKKYWPIPTYSDLLYKDTPQMPYNEYK